MNAVPPGERDGESMVEQGEKHDGLRPVPRDRIPAFNNLLGMDNLRSGDGEAEIGLGLQADFTNRRGVAHGGLVAALLDSVLGAAVVSGIRPEEWCGTVQLNIQFLSAARGRRLVGRGTMVKRGRHLAFARGEVQDESGSQVATAEGTWYIWPSRPPD